MNTSRSINGNQQQETNPYHTPTAPKEQLGWHHFSDRIYHDHPALLHGDPLAGLGDFANGSGLSSGSGQHEHYMTMLDRSLDLLLGLPEYIQAQDATWDAIAKAVAAINSAKAFLRRDFNAGH
jgi:hypothetical protein